MKQVLLFLSVATFILFTSCEKDAEPESITLAQDLQNGYWESTLTNGTIIVYSFNTSTSTVYLINGTPLCVVASYPQDYILDGKILTFGDNGAQVTIEIKDDILTITASNGVPIPLERKPTVNYPDC